MRRVSLKEIKTQYLPKEVLDEVQSDGVELEKWLFQEILLYRGRQLIGSIGGIWSSHQENGQDIFYPRSYGSKTLQWDGENVYHPFEFSVAVYVNSQNEAQTAINRLRQLDLVNKDFKVLKARDQIIATFTIFKKEREKLNNLLAEKIGQEQFFVFSSENDINKTESHWQMERMV